MSERASPHLVLVSVGPRLPSKLCFCAPSEPALCWGWGDGPKAPSPSGRGRCSCLSASCALLSGPIVQGPPGFHTHATGSGAGGQGSPLEAGGLQQGL